MFKYNLITDNTEIPFGIIVIEHIWELQVIYFFTEYNSVYFWKNIDNETKNIKKTFILFTLM